MTEDQLDHWKYFRTEVVCAWGDITSDDLNDVAGSRSKLVALLQVRYGFSAGRAAREVDMLLREFSTRLKKAS